jgi:peptidoglycan hydrolase-like protein with peptidoglycan-binding domain
MGIIYPDISSYQAGISLAGQPAVCIKATEGGGPNAPRYTNPDYPRAAAEARSRGIDYYAYHYLHSGDSPDWVVVNVGPVPLMIDAEAPGLQLSDIHSFMQGYEIKQGGVKFVYLPRWRWVEMGSPDLQPLMANDIKLVSSDYSAGYAANAPGWQPYGGVTPTILQYTDQGTVNSVNPVDLNYYPGTPDDFHTLLYGTAPAGSYPPFPGRNLKVTNPYMKGGDILVWQKQMAHRGWIITADSIYGPESQAVCKAFQQDSNAHHWPLTVDGIVGRKTWQASWARPISH